MELAPWNFQEGVDRETKVQFGMALSPYSI